MNRRSLVITFTNGTQMFNVFLHALTNEPQNEPENRAKLYSLLSIHKQCHIVLRWPVASAERKRKLFGLVLSC